MALSKGLLEEQKAFWAIRSPEYKAYIDSLKQETKDTFLAIYVYLNQYNHAKEYILIGANPSQAVYQDESCLFEAIRKGNLKMIRLLLDASIDLDIYDLDGKTPFEFILDEDYDYIRPNLQLWFEQAQLDRIAGHTQDQELNTL